MSEMSGFGEIITTNGDIVAMTPENTTLREYALREIMNHIEVRALGKNFYVWPFEDAYEAIARGAKEDGVEVVDLVIPTSDIEDAYVKEAADPLRKADSFPAEWRRPLM